MFTRDTAWYKGGMQSVLQKKGPQSLSMDLTESGGEGTPPGGRQRAKEQHCRPRGERVQKLCSRQGSGPKVPKEGWCPGARERAGEGAGGVGPFIGVWVGPGSNGKPSGVLNMTRSALLEHLLWLQEG